MHRRLLTLVALFAFLAPAATARAAVEDPGGPLVYVFVLDGLDGDRVDTGRAPYIASLLAGEDGARATYYRESRSIMVAETNPNHTAMATGAYGDKSGIPGNSFAVYAASDGSSCPTGPTDESKPPATTDGTDPNCLQAETIFEALQRQPGADAVVSAGIFGKPKLARLFAGRKADPGRYDADYLWTPCLQPSDDEPFCKQVPNRPSDEYAILDETVMDEVVRTVRDGVPGDGRTFTGGGRRPSLTFVNFPGIDSSGHATGAGGEYDGAIARADAQVRRFVAEQKRLGLWERTTVVLLSDHSMDSTPQKTTLAQRFNARGIPSGAYEIVQNGSAALVYLTDRTDPGRFALLKAMREAATDGADALSQLAGPPSVEALYREPNPADGGGANTLAGRRPAWRLAGPRTGDLVVTSRGGTSFNDPVNPLAGNHGGPQTRDNFLAVIGGSPAIEQRAIAGPQDPLFDDTERNPSQAENVDVAPTALRLLGRGAPAQSEGRFLAEAFRPQALPAQLPGRPAVPGAPPAPAQSTGCSPAAGLRAVSARRSGRGLRVRFTGSDARVDISQRSAGRRILRNRRVARFTRRSRSVRWDGRDRRGARVRDGVFVVRARRGSQVRRLAVRRRDGRFRARPAFERRAACGPVSSLKLSAPVFGGRSGRGLAASYRLADAGRVRVDLLRGGRVVRRLSRAADRLPGRTYRLRVRATGLRRGEHRVRLRWTPRSGGSTETAVVTARRL